MFVSHPADAICLADTAEREKGHADASAVPGDKMSIIGEMFTKMMAVVGI